MRRSWLPATLLIAQLGATLIAQQPTPSPAPQQTPQPQSTQTQKDVDVVRITTNLVQVDAVVTDKSGKLVTDLKPEEVQIFEDGRQQKISHFTYYASEPTAATRSEKPASADRDAPPAPAVRLKPEDVRRAIAIVVDDLGLSFESMYYVRRALKKFVDEQMQPGDLVAIIRTSGGMGALQQFTADRRQLYAAIERVKWNALGRSGISPFEPIQPPTPGGAEVEAAIEEMDRFRHDVFAVGTLGAVSYVVKGLHDLPGRKSILLISDGFRIMNREDPTENLRTLERLRGLVDEAGRSAVVIYTMNATGLQTLGLTAADSTGERSAAEIETQLSNRRQFAFETNEGLDYLARETGGIPIRNTNDLSGGIRRVLEDQKGYYLIGYRPDQSTFDPKTGRRTFHHLSLKITRPGKYSVRMRNGFYGVTDEDRRPVARTLAQQMVSALVSPFGANGVHLQLTSLFANDPTAGSFMRSVLHIDARDLTFTDEPDHSHKCVFDVLAMTFGDNGVLVDQSGRTYTVRLPDESYKRALRDGFVYYVTVPIKKPGAYQLRMSFRDTSSERVGSASQFIEVPDLKKNRLALSSLTLVGRSPNTSAANESRAVGDQAGVEKGSAEASAAVRHFSRGMLMDYAFYIYNSRPDKASNHPQLTTQVRLFRDGKLVFSGKENPFAAPEQADYKRLLAGGSIQLGTDLTPGEYVIQIIVSDQLADAKHRTITQSMDFEIVK